MTKLQIKIQKIFTQTNPAAGYRREPIPLISYRESVRDNSVSFQVMHQAITFDRLSKLSKLLKTKIINLPDIHTTRNEDTFGGTRDYDHEVEVEATKVKFRPLEDFWS